MFPEHIQVLMRGKKLSHLEGCALYLLGRLYQGWIAPELKDSFGRDQIRDRTSPLRLVETTSSHEQLNMKQAFEHLCKSVRPKYLNDDIEEVGCNDEVFSLLP